jgi:hypothetical protein
VARNYDGDVDGGVVKLAAAPEVGRRANEERTGSKHRWIEVENMDKMTEKRGESGQMSGAKGSLRLESSGC